MQQKFGVAAMKKILLVDSETFFLQVLKRALQGPSTEVKTVETGKAALQEVAAFHYHLCLLDIYLTDIDGIEVLKRIAEISPKTKVIIMTAGDITSNMQQIIEKHAYMFLSKPFDLIQLRMLTKSIPGEVAS
ncbi:MAG TPA: response regulator [Syntrophales bacterium]|nr:response regulator [Syntrophales bacterium]